MTFEAEALEQGAPVWTRFGDDAFPSLPKMAAVRRAFEAGIDEGLPEPFAGMLAHAAVDPAAVRTALRNPTRLHVPGGVVHVVDIDLWVPGVVPMPTNNRTMDARIYPAAGVAGAAGPLTGPVSSLGATSTLVVSAQSVEHVIDEARRAASFILRANPLRSSIAGRGILMPVDVVFVEIDHADGQPRASLLATAEGSSRVTNAQAILGLNDPTTTHYAFPADRDVFRRFINEIANVEGDELSPREAARLRERRNALIVPSRVFLRFEPAAASGYDYARAMYGYLGALHVDPPKPWSQTGKLEAMAESVLRALRAENTIEPVQYDYLAGYLTPDRADAAGFPVRSDEQAAYVLAELLRPDRQPAVDRGIKDVTAKRSVSAGRRADVVAELALRPTRSHALASGEAGTVDRAEAMRSGYLRASRLPAFAAEQWSVSGGSPADLRDAALAELRRSRRGTPGWRARAELAAIAQYHLTFWGALRREPHGSGGTDADKRGPHEVLRLMLVDQQGIHLLYQAIVDGRANQAPRAVDAEGELLRGSWDPEAGFEFDASGPEIHVSDQMLRRELYSGDPVGRRRKPVPLHETPAMAVLRLQAEVGDLVDDLMSYLDQLAKQVGPNDRPIVDDDGWHAQDLVAKLAEAHQLLVGWTFVARTAGSRATRTPEHDDLPDDEADRDDDE